MSELAQSAERHELSDALEKLSQEGARLQTVDPSRFDPSRYDTTQDRCMPSRPRFANPTGQPQMFVKPEPRMPPTTRLVTRQVLTAVVRCISHGLLLVVAACNHPNCLVLPFRLELIRPAA